MSRILLLVELKGGNDGLNTVIPYADPLYRDLRPGIGLARERVLQLDEHVGLHARLEPLMDAWQARDLAIVQGVGYPGPNRSHFRSIEIWDTASSSSRTLSEGWVARALEHAALPASLGRGTGVDGIVIDTNALPLMGADLRTVVMQDAEAFLRAAPALKDDPVDDGGNLALRHLLAVRREVNAAATGLREKLQAAPRPAHAYASSPFGQQLDLATRLIAGGVPVLALKIALAGFDTHANQAPTHEALLAVLAEGLATFRRNMIVARRWDDVLVLTYSEFGRRAGQNASAGTDHGTAAPLFVLGGRAKGGLQGSHPSLADLEDGDLRHTVDFRDVYSAVARGCWAQSVSFGQRTIQKLDLVAP
ncbi:MAG TPA: DUF1501 domain-containing protein [Reyranella sp.]|jgi:uncharacterized protein (DUF1501 family)